MRDDPQHSAQDPNGVSIAALESATDQKHEVTSNARRRGRVERCADVRPNEGVAEPSAKVRKVAIADAPPSTRQPRDDAPALSSNGAARRHRSVLRSDVVLRSEDA